MSPTHGLTIAVPRGALFSGTVELLAALGLDTEELSSNDRKLLFKDIGVITMRPSDVPTYVEAGAADLGVTGKDVLLEQAPQWPGEGGREVYELLDLGYGRCTMVLASKSGPDPALEQHILAGNAEVRRPRLDVRGYVGRAHRDHADVLEEQLAVVGAQLLRIEPQRGQKLDRAREQRAPGDRDREAVCGAHGEPSGAAAVAPGRAPERVEGAGLS